MSEEDVNCARATIVRIRIRRATSLAAVSLAAVLWVPSSASASIVAGSTTFEPDTQNTLLPGIRLPGAAGSMSHHPDLDILQLVKKPSLTAPVIDGFGQIQPPSDPEDGELGIGGLEMAWNPDELFSVAMVVGGRMGAMDSDWSAAEHQDTGPSFDEAITGLTGAPTAFNGLGFGGLFGAEIDPFNAGRVFVPNQAEDDLAAAFIATRAKFRPSEATTFGFVATRGGAASQDTSIFGFDVAQEIGEHQVEAWLQQSLGSSDRSKVESDRSAIGASLGGDLFGLRYAVGWRRIGDGFESGLGATGARGSHAMLGRIDGGIALESIPFLRRWEFGLQARVDTDLELDPNAVDLDIDAIRLVATTGDRLEFGVRQAKRIQTQEFSETEREIETHERYRIGISSNPSRSVQWQGQVDFGDPEANIVATWKGRARWSPGGGFQIGGMLAADRRLDDRRTNETLRAAVDGGFGIGRAGTVRSRFGFDGSSSQVSLGHSIGWNLDHNASIAISVEQDLPVIVMDGRTPVTRTRLSGRFEF